MVPSSVQRDTDYKNLSRIIAVLLDHKSPLGMDLGQLRETFLDGLANTLQCSLDINITEEQFATLSGEWTTHANLVDEFLVKTIEHPQSYTLVNYYYVNFIKILLKNIPSHSKKDVWDILLENNIGLSDFDRIEAEYEEMMKRLKKKNQG